jgi:hypothetical protein
MRRERSLPLYARDCVSERMKTTVGAIARTDKMIFALSAPDADKSKWTAPATTLVPIRPVKGVSIYKTSTVQNVCVDET